MIDGLGDWEKARSFLVGIQNGCVNKFLMVVWINLIDRTIWSAGKVGEQIYNQGSMKDKRCSFLMEEREHPTSAMLIRLLGINNTAILFVLPEPEY